MHVAIVLFKYFPYGGLQRDMAKIARLLTTHGMRVTIYCNEWHGDAITFCDVRVLSVWAWSSNAARLKFERACLAEIKAADIDLVFGFNKMAGLDLYFAADACFAEKAMNQRGWLYRQTPRAKQYLRAEADVFGRHSRTRILMISTNQARPYLGFYPDSAGRTTLLPPSVDRKFVWEEGCVTVRENVRRAFALESETIVGLFVASYFHTKGLDRVFSAVAQLDPQLRARFRLLVVGNDVKAHEKFANMAARLGLTDRVTFLGARDDVNELMWASDLLLHPARVEAAGMVILEAALAGLPVVVSDVCGYAPYISQYGMGFVVDPAKDFHGFVDKITEVACTAPAEWKARSHIMSNSSDVFDREYVLMQVIDTIAAKKIEEGEGRHETL